MRWFFLSKSFTICSGDTWSASGPNTSSGGVESVASAGTHHTPARRSVPASVSSSAGPSPSNTKRAWPPRGFADCFGVGEQTPTLHEMHDEVHGFELENEVFAAPADGGER